MLAVSHFERGLAALEQAAEASSLLEQALRAGWGTLTLGKVLSSLALLLACLAAVRLLTALAGRLLGRTTADARTRGYILKGTRTALYLFAALIFAGSLGIDVTSLIALVSVFGLAVSLAIQDILSNVAAGIELLLAKPFALGDYVATEDAEGEVAEITLTHTKLDTFGGQRVMLPNSKLSEGKIVNYTVRGIRRAELSVCASYGDSAEAVRAACLRAISRAENVLSDPPPQAVVFAYGSSTVEYRVRFWAETKFFWDAHNSVLEDLRTVFEEDGITMSYPHVNVHIMDEK